jgi:penicillin-binding protein 2
MFVRRLLVFLAVLAVGYTIIIARLSWMQVFRSTEFAEHAEKARTYIDVLDWERGKVFFRNSFLAAKTEGIFNVSAILPELDSRFSAISLLVKFTKPTRRTLSKRMLEFEDAVAASVNPALSRLFVENVSAKGVRLMKEALKQDSGLKNAFVFRKNPSEPGRFDLYIRFDWLVAKKWRTIEKLAGFLGVEAVELHAKTDDAVRKVMGIANDFEYRVRRDAPITLVKDIPCGKAFELDVCMAEFPGIIVSIDQKRRYPGGDLACHVLGYLGPLSPEEYGVLESRGRIIWRGPKLFSVLDLMQDGNVFFADELVGRCGVEKWYEPVLSGAKGVAIFERWPDRTDPEMHEHISPVDGIDLNLTIDAEMQRITEDVYKACGENGGPVCGAAVVIEVKTGAVLVLASSPGFDLNTFRKREEYESLKTLPSPFLNRAIQACVPPGSVFKALVALAALEEGIISPGTSIRCRGYLHNPKAFRCRNHSPGVSPMDVTEALCRSCNVFFYTLGERLNQGGRERLQNWAKMCGFGVLTGIDLPGERSGILLDPQWKQKRPLRAQKHLVGLKKRELEAPQELAKLCVEREEIEAMEIKPRPIYRRQLEIERKIKKLEQEIDRLPTNILAAENRLEWARADSEWTKGNDRFLGIGEGGVLVTPLQVARFMAVIANGGRFYRPHLVTGTGANYLEKQIRFSDSALAAIRRGMEMVVHDLRGTANHTRDAEGRRVPSALSHLPVAAKTGTAETDRKRNLNQAWIAGYGPIDNPEIAFAFTVENTKGHGGEVCGPIAAQILASYFSRQEGP